MRISKLPEPDALQCIGGLCCHRPEFSNGPDPERTRLFAAELRPFDVAYDVACGPRAESSVQLLNYAKLRELMSVKVIAIDPKLSPDLEGEVRYVRAPIQDVLRESGLLERAVSDDENDLLLALGEYALKADVRAFLLVGCKLSRRENAEVIKKIEGMFIARGYTPIKESRISQTAPYAFMVKRSPPTPILVPGLDMPVASRAEAEFREHEFKRGVGLYD